MKEENVFAIVFELSVPMGLVDYDINDDLIITRSRVVAHHLKIEKWVKVFWNYFSVCNMPLLCIVQK